MWMSRNSRIVFAALPLALGCPAAEGDSGGTDGGSGSDSDIGDDESGSSTSVEESQPIA